MQNARQVTVFDPKTKKISFIDTCFGTHHLNFAEDADNTLWLSNNSGGNLAVVGWVNTKKYWETGDAAKSQKFAARMLEKGVYVIGFFYPVVPHGTARVRTQVSAAHSREDLEFAVNAFAETNAELA